MFYWKAPGLFHLLPTSARQEQVRTWLGAAPGWFVRSRVEGKFPAHLGWHIAGAEADGGGVKLRLRNAEGAARTLAVDHVIAATGFKTDIARLPFLDASMLREIATVSGAPLLSRDFESSLANLHIVGPSAALSFGPLMRFAAGADYAARRLARHLARRRPVAHARSDEVVGEPLTAAE